MNPVASSPRPTAMGPMKQTLESSPAPVPCGTSVKCVVAALDGEGAILVRLADGTIASCDWLDTGGALLRPLSPGDAVLVLWPREGERGIVIGRIGPYRPTLPIDSLRLEGGQSLTLECGDSSLSLRADGKVVIKGEDVLVRAKGTKRIRAGSVSIN